MNPAIFVLMASFLLAGTVQAQVRKCVSSTGKITYSDFLCEKDTSRESAVATNQNNVDMSASRQGVEAHNKAAATEKAIEQGLQKGLSTCKFPYYAYGDSKGKDLAAAAKQECFDNIVAKAKGLPTSREQYGFWQDHHQIKSTQRSKPSNSMTCVPNNLGGLRCN